MVCRVSYGWAIIARRPDSSLNKIAISGRLPRGEGVIQFMTLRQPRFLDTTGWNRNDFIQGVLCGTGSKGEWHERGTNAAQDAYVVGIER